MLVSPLQWPATKPRTRSPKRSGFSVSLADAHDHLCDELHRLGATKVTISSNARLNLNGTISAKQPPLNDTGVAVFFTRKGQESVIACDRWNTVAANLRAIGLTVAAMRGIERWGTTEMVDAAFIGFTALPEGETCWDVLRLPPYAERSLVESRYRELAKRFHPDVGGNPEQFQHYTRAYQQALAAKRS